MSITFRNYKMLADFEKVSNFLRNKYREYHQVGNMVQPAFEYAHVHPHFDSKLAHRFGIWEENGEIVGVAFYETNLGEAFLNCKIGYEFLKKEMLDYAEKELSEKVNGKNKLAVFIYDFETEIKKDLEEKGYKLQYEEPITIYDYEKGFKDLKLPEGFKLISLEDENDFKKINDVLWKGFDHGDEPDDDLDCRKLMQSSPNFRKDLTTIIKAPNGEYATFAGFWLDGTNPFAYLEPLATDPIYRRKGLATIALMEGMKKTQKFGAKYCYGGSREFYFSIGFTKVCTREIWEKEWE